MSIFVPSLWVVVGIALFAGIFFTLVGSKRDREPAYLPFGLMCLLLSIEFMIAIYEYGPHHEAMIFTVTRIRYLILCSIYPMSVWVLGEYSEDKSLKLWVGLYTIVYGSLMVFLTLMPGTYSGPVVVRHFMLPWGEVLYDYDFLSSTMLIVYYLVSYTIFIWIIWRIIDMWRQGYQRKAIPMAIYVILQFALLTWDRINGLLNIIPHIPPIAIYGPIILILIMSYALLREMQRRNIQLQERTDELWKSYGELRKETQKRSDVENRLQHVAYHDYLTNLPNRHLLNDKLSTTLKQHSASGQFGAVLILDIDQFKSINDSIGHQLGDQVLQQVADRLQNALPDSRCVARLGGDEFAAVIGDLGNNLKAAEAAAQEAAEMLRASLVRSINISGRDFSLNTSVGITLFPKENTEVSGLFRQADLALYSAKASGGNTAAVFAEEMLDDSDTKQDDEKELHKALDKGKLALFFRPQMNMRGQFIGAEALLRWKHPVHGLMDIKHFLDMSEESGLIHKIGDYALQKACSQLRKWDRAKAPSPPRLTISVSPWQLAPDDYTQKVIHIIKKSGLEPARLTIGVAEKALLQNIDEVADTVHELGVIGIRFSIDDFGSSYSALASLKKLPMHELKLDKHIIGDMHITPPDQFIGTIISIANEMGLFVIAKGVETEAQLIALEKLGCGGYQGYQNSAPLSVTDFEEWMSKHHNITKSRSRRRLRLTSSK